MIILQFLDVSPMHGYHVITKIRKCFGVYFGPSTVYPFLGTLEKKGYVKSYWSMDAERPRKVYELTSDGRAVLNFTEGQLRPDLPHVKQRQQQQSKIAIQVNLPQKRHI